MDDRLAAVDPLLGFVDMSTLIHALHADGVLIPEGTLRRWAASQSVQRRRLGGRTFYRARDLLPYAQQWDARSRAHETATRNDEVDD